MINSAIQGIPKLETQLPLLETIISHSAFLATLREISLKIFLQKSKFLTNKDEPRGLKESFIIPVWVNFLQNVTHPVVLTEPDGGVHHEAWDQTERLVANSEALRVWDVWRVVHFNTNILNQWRVHLSLYHL